MAVLHKRETEAEPLDRPRARVAQVLRQLTESVLDGGWQPADLVHVVKREWTARASRLAIAFIADHARRFDAPTRAPHPWLSQLQDLGVVDADRTAVSGGRGDLIAGWARAKIHIGECCSE